MPPPYNSIDRARREVLEEPPPAYYFPPVGQGRNSFAPAVDSGLAAQSRLALDAILNQRDKEATVREENQTRRLETAGRRSILPYSTAAQIAAEKARAAQAALDEADSPFLSEARRERAQTDSQQEQATRRALPETEQLETLKRQGELDAVQSGEDRLKRDGIDALAYDFHYRHPDIAKLPPKERQRQARNATLRLQHDQPYVAAVEQEALESGDNTIRDKYVEDLIDEETGARFSRIKKGVPPGEVSTLLRKRAYSKEQAAREKMELAAAREERMANAAFDNNRLLALKEAKATAAITAKDDAADPAARAAALKELADIDTAIKEIALRPIVRPERTKASEEKAVAPAPAAAEEKKPSKTSYLEEAKKAALGE